MRGCRAWGRGASDEVFLLALINRVFDLFFWPFRSVDPIFGLAAISCLMSLLMVVVFRYASNQQALQRAKERMQAHLLEVRLFQDQLGVALRAYGRILRWTLIYLKHTLRPLALLFVPLVLILVQLDLRLGRGAPRPGEFFLLKAGLADAAGIEQVSLRVPEGLSLTAPPLRIPGQREVDWRLRTEKTGEFVAAVLVSGQAFSKRITVSKQIALLPAKRVRSQLFQRLLDPGETPLPSAGPLEWVAVSYRHRSMDLKYFQVHWLWPFLVISLVVGFALKKVLRTEF